MSFHPTCSLRCWTFAFLWLPAMAVLAQDDADPGWDVRFQNTYIWQKKPGFRAAYSGENSLSPLPEKSYSFTTTVFMGLRLGPNTEFYFNPEFVQGVPLSRLAGMGGLSNGELQKTAGSQLSAYRARAFVRHTWSLGGAADSVGADLNQLAARRDNNRVVLTAGNLAVGDIFDDNAYAHDARTDFMNWGFLTHGAYDFAADARGYSWGTALEVYQADWVLRAGRFAMPKESNGVAIDFALGRHYGDQLELEKAYTVAGQPGKMRLLAYRNVAEMGNFSAALANAQASGSPPDIATSRQLRSKRGWGVNLEQALGKDLGLFARFGRHDGAAETFAFAEIDQSASLGAVVSGTRWGRAPDAVGLAQVRHALSGSHRAYLAAGGYGFFIGDGRLNYAQETITEAYYRWGLGLPRLNNAALTLGFQHIKNPGYNADRGPVKLLALR
ncbi:MAG: hypothetical protein RLZZ401_1155, partial [Pseudomonadota bacterium]